ncbi:MAG: lipid-A-disaccharide synthase [Ignavibacteriota bacterium]|nr:MAG: lipid-A-disaccharide synthase [Chlorobiota bacterium]MBE7476185.1 lipid-A-disaccharide synthase [Ignavibacteriales bacterium]MBL1124470.1 lipid-A-disaccharide synthase [Ignavibacteriota bacterium]MCC7094378.1 lipid-A-disaccharide synthase [Ignavibacteriaceae bacterium]MCE7856510.1 lipid-A-disaccharide synthase [Ignavibacteria bacterium CHB3]MEB2296446.1 lipid-A-disaccharide synthase [Ignavibacteria bacterium]
MNSPNNKLLIITGEVSGDLIGASLIRELKSLQPELIITGIGGDRMKSSGMNLIYHSDQMAILGFVEVIKHLPFIRQVRKKIIETVIQENIRCVVLIDYPGFNLNIAKKLKERGIKIIYYVSPQIWAWAKGRVKKVQRFVDKMLVVFPFEVEFYNNEKVNVEYVGHPLVERISQYNFFSKEDFFAKYNLDEEKKTLLVMPGSREQEVKEIFPETIKAADMLAKKFDLQVVVAKSKNIDAKVFRDLSVSEKFTLIEDHNYELMKYSYFGIIKSGTSTLEAGYFTLPMVVVYKTSSLTYLIGKQLIKLDKIGMVNILLDKMVVPELIQNEANSENIFNTTSKIISDEKIYQSIKHKLEFVKEKLGSGGASKKAAKTILEIMNEP